ncbi:MAG: hypothetical protein ACM4D3_18290 [Candidatus Sericytochromatia bacterium]
MCRNDQIQAQVNQLLAEGSTYRGIFRSLKGENAALDQRDRVSWESVQHHAKRHFPVQNVARATYREILERRAAENAIDFANGVGTAITPLAYLEIIMVKGFQYLIDENTVVPYRDGARAAALLQELTRKDAGEQDIAPIYVKQQRIIDTMLEVVPEEYHEEILARLEGI